MKITRNSLGTLSLSQFPACCPDGLGSVSDSRMASSASVVDSLAPAVHLLLRWLLAFGYVITPSSPVLIVASLREFSRVKSISASSYSSEPSPVVLIIDRLFLLSSRVEATSSFNHKRYLVFHLGKSVD